MSRFVNKLAVGAVLSLVFSSLVFSPVWADDDYGLFLSPDDEESKIGDKIYVTGLGLDAGEYYYLYFSSDKVDEGAAIDGKITHYALLERNIKTTGDDDPEPGRFETAFIVPDVLDDGEDIEDVHGGEYYIYLTHRTGDTVVNSASLNIYGGEIEVAAGSGAVGSEIEINGWGLRPDQDIEIKYDGVELDITGGDTGTDADGEFVCSVAVPEGLAGEHTIVARDESGNRPETVFEVIPAITVSPATQAVDGVVEVKGAGFAYRETVTVSLNGTKLVTTPVDLHTNRLGSLGGSFVIPPHPDFIDGSTVDIGVRDESYHSAETELTVLPIVSRISLTPEVSQHEPGYVGMELAVSGIWFVPDAALEITYDNGDDDTLIITQVNNSRNFSASFIVPPGSQGSHEITASDGKNSASIVFIMESAAPLEPVLLPVTFTPDVVPHFDWEDVNDPSGVTYTLEVSRDSSFTDVFLEKTGLTGSEYTPTDESEIFEPVGSDSPYYWRVKAIDATSLEGAWSTPSSFDYEDTPAVENDMTNLWVAIGAAAVVLVIMKVRKKEGE